MYKNLYKYLIKEHLIYEIRERERFYFIYDFDCATIDAIVDELCSKSSISELDYVNRNWNTLRKKLGIFDEGQEQSYEDIANATNVTYKVIQDRITLILIEIKRIIGHERFENSTPEQKQIMKDTEYLCVIREFLWYKAVDTGDWSAVDELTNQMNDLLISPINTQVENISKKHFEIHI